MTGNMLKPTGSQTSAAPPAGAKPAAAITGERSEPADRGAQRPYRGSEASAAYSCRSAVAGSIRDARAAGRYVAPNATVNSSSVAAVSVTGS